jgi:hypothetical protein
MLIEEAALRVCRAVTTVVKAGAPVSGSSVELSDDRAAACSSGSSASWAVAGAQYASAASGKNAMTLAGGRDFAKA